VPSAACLSDEASPICGFIKSLAEALAHTGAKLSPLREPLRVAGPMSAPDLLALNHEGLDFRRCDEAQVSRGRREAIREVVAPAAKESPLDEAHEDEADELKRRPSHLPLKPAVSAGEARLRRLVLAFQEEIIECGEISAHGALQLIAVGRDAGLPEGARLAPRVEDETKDSGRGHGSSPDERPFDIARHAPSVAGVADMSGAYTSIIEKGREVLTQHAQFVELRDAASETELRATMSWTGDERRHADLNVFFIPTPT
jgi:hypothetical protein